MSCAHCKNGAPIPCTNDSRFTFRIFRGFGQNDNHLRIIAPNGTAKEAHANYCIVCGDKLEKGEQNG